MEPDSTFLLELADAADRETLPRFRAGGGVDNKLGAGAFDPVTEADRAAETAIRAHIAARFPDHAILGEEFGERPGNLRQWVIDPIDGTRAFITGLPVWGTLVGHYVEGRARLGLMSQPFTGERFYADGAGAFLKRGDGAPQQLATRKAERLAGATLFTTSPRLFSGDLLPRFEALEGAVRLSRYGTDCYAFAMLAAGHVDLVVESGLKPYDIAALIALIEQAGGVVTTISGDRPEQGGDIVAAATPELHAAACAILVG
ncbi:histidinol-phosphatase [Jiella sp. MQZ9-1]|uniref:Histidinol-phosphatase n=1 Tax=Jiella flava TaxID=2816857 RepID=A0A939FWK5_9HYPH|nr:histidinol-phosphatase [Jiella flava]MBO0661378.1 histidinol-phosphatase [Jiella flava]MCD2470023.1 histidinol-phosphatase [Jiella flava]